MLTLLACRYPAGAEPSVITGVRRLLSGWFGLGRIAVGMARQGYDLQLTRYGDEGWRATFYPAGRGHSVTAAVGSAWEREPWTAVQRPAWERLRRQGNGGGGDHSRFAGEPVSRLNSRRALTRETLRGSMGPRPILGHGGSPQ